MTTNKVSTIEALLEELTLDEATEVLDLLLMQVITLRAEQEKANKLSVVGDVEPAPVASLDEYRKPPEPINLSDYRNRSKD